MPGGGIEHDTAPTCQARSLAGNRSDGIVAADENGIICFPPGAAQAIVRSASKVEKVMPTIRERADAIVITQRCVTTHPGPINWVKKERQ